MLEIRPKVVTVSNSYQESAILCGTYNDNSDWLMQQNMLINQHIPNANTYLEKGNIVIQEIQDTMQEIKNSIVSRITMVEDSIKYITIEKLPEANPTMQRYIMANPKLNLKLKQNLVDGYPDTYFNREPDTYGISRTDYQEVVDGVIEHNSVRGVVRYYSNSGMEELSTLQKIDILRTWDNVELLLSKKLDPTNFEDNDIEDKD